MYAFFGFGAGASNFKIYTSFSNVSDDYGLSDFGFCYFDFDLGVGIGISGSIIG